jgi:hypothetical protein
MKKWILLFFLLPTITIGQKEVSNWFFYSSGLDFNCDPVQPIAPSANFFPIEGCSSISDEFGNLLFYTDGYFVFDKNHDIMLNGVDIGIDTTCGSSSTQGVMIVKQPLQDSLYYIFTTDCAENKLADGFCYSIVNMNLNEGKGEVILKKEVLLPKTCEKLCAVRHSNGIDTWILTHEWGNANFAAFLLSPAGISLTPVISETGRIQLPEDLTDLYPGYPYPEAAARGHLKFSPQGDRLVAVSTSDGHDSEWHAELFSFNATTGVVMHDFDIPTSDTAIYYGASFSPNGNLLYTSGGWYGDYIHQFNLVPYDSVSVAESKYIVYKDPLDTIPGVPSALQIGPDGKIYNAINFLNLNVIADPNQPGADCDFRLNEVILPIDTCHYGSSVFGLPNNDESFYLTSFIGSTCEPIMLTDFNTLDSCPGLPVYFFDASNYYPYSINHWSWDFGDPDSGPLNFSDLQNPQHTYSSNGFYEVTLIAYSDTFSFCKTGTITKMIAINCATVVQNGIDQLNSLDDDVNVYPNPVNDLLYIASDQHIKEVRLFNAQGALVFQKNDNFNIEKIELNLANGIYFLELSNENGSAQKKILINRGI